MLQRRSWSFPRRRRRRENYSSRRAQNYGTTSAEMFDHAHVSKYPMAMENSEQSFIHPFGSSTLLDTIASALQQCAKDKALSAGRSCHDFILNLAYDSHPYIQSLLVQMYACSDALDDALYVFVTSHHHHLQSFIWNHIISALVLHHQYSRALQMFERMRQQCVIPDKFTFISILSVFTSSEYIDKGKRLHAIIFTCGLHHNVVLETTLITMYHKCGSLDSAWITFERILQPDEVAWTAIIAAYAQHHKSLQALHLLDLMLQEGFGPSKVTLACTIDACANCTSLNEGKVLHSYIVEHGVKVDKLLENALIRLYGVCGSMNDARHVYDGMESRDIVSFNSIIIAHSQSGQAKEAFKIFGCLFREGGVPNKATYTFVLDACVTAATEGEGKKIHGFIVDAGYDQDQTIATKLVRMYGKCGRVEDAQRLFEQMQERNVATWTTMIAGLVQQGRSEEALLFFSRMQQQGTKPNRSSYLCMLDACASLSIPVKAKHGHVYVLNCSFGMDIIICNFLISMYGKCGSIEDAREVFDRMPQHDLVSWTAMIGVYGQCCRGKEAFQLFSEMQQEVGANQVTYVCSIDSCANCALLIEGKLIHFCLAYDGLDTDQKTLNSLVNMYGKCGSLEDALNTFISTAEHDIISWTAMIGAYAQCRKLEEALRHFEEMLQQGFIPNMVTFVSILDVYDSEKLMVLGKQMHSRIMACGLVSNATIGNALIKMYGRCHGVDSALKMFESMVEWDIVSWTAIIAVHAQHAKGKEALELFDQMQHRGFQPNIVTFVCSLDACASLSALAIGEHIHNLIVRSNLESDVVVRTALVNMYGKCGQLYSAHRVFSHMKMRNLLAWTAIIAIYAHHGNGEEAVMLFEKMEEEGFRADDVALVTILAACSHSGLVNEGSLIFTKALKNGNISPSVEHYVCMIDLLGRAGRLNEAELLVRDMPFEPTAVGFTSLLGSCRQKGDLHSGERSAMRALGMDSQDSAPYVVLSNIYACVEREEPGRNRGRDTTLWEELAYCSNDFHDKVHGSLDE